MKISQELLYMPCPCNSGKKFKFCCLETVREHLPFAPDKADITMAVRKAKEVYGMVNNVDPYEDRDAIQTMFKAMEMRRAGMPLEALEALIEARTKTPQLYTAWNNEAQIKWTMGHLEEAIQTQREGLSHSAHCNAYGWAQLASYHYFLTQNEAYEECLQKALAIAPISEDAASRVCSALSLQKRHHAIIAYAEKSGFDEAPQVAYYLMLALINVGNEQKARTLFEKSDLQFLPLYIVKEALEAAENDEIVETYGPEISQRVPYFFTCPPDTDHLCGHIFAYPRPAYENLACDIVESYLRLEDITKDDALEALSYFKGERANRLRAIIPTLPDYTLPKTTYTPGTIGGELAISRVLENDADVLPVLLHRNLSPLYTNIPEDADREYLNSILETIFNRRKGSKTVKAALQSLADFCEKYPHHDTLKAQYAYCLLRDNRAEEALVILQNLLEKSPDLFCARTYLVEIATKLKQLELAKHYIDTAEVPLSIHAGIYLKWQNALASYYKATDEKAHQKVARKRAQQALDAIREEIEESFDD